MQLLLRRNKNFFSNYITIRRKFEQDLKAYYSSIEMLAKPLKNLEDIRFLSKLLHPLVEIISLKNTFEEELKFYDWALKNYPLSAEKRLELRTRKNVLEKELNAICRLLKSLKEKWDR